MFKNSAFLKNIYNNFPTISLCFIFIMIILVIVQYYFLNKELAMTIIQSFFVSALVCL